MKGLVALQPQAQSCNQGDHDDNPDRDEHPLPMEGVQELIRLPAEAAAEAEEDCDPEDHGNERACEEQGIRDAGHTGAHGYRNAKARNVSADDDEPCTMSLEVVLDGQ